MKNLAILEQSDIHLLDAIKNKFLLLSSGTLYTIVDYSTAEVEIPERWLIFKTGRNKKVTILSNIILYSGSGMVHVPGAKYHDIKEVILKFVTSRIRFIKFFNDFNKMSNTSNMVIET